VQHQKPAEIQQVEATAWIENQHYQPYSPLQPKLQQMSAQKAIQKDRT
jgi:hypothetical protein